MIVFFTASASVYHLSDKSFVALLITGSLMNGVLAMSANSLSELLYVDKVEQEELEQILVCPGVSLFASATLPAMAKC